MNSSSSLAAELMAQLQGAPMQQMADQIGASPAQTESAVGAALPVLLASLGRNAADPQGAANLFGALLVAAQDVAQDGRAIEPATCIAARACAAAQQRAQDGLGQATGLGSGGAAQLLQLLAPIVMSFLAQRVSAGGMDAGGLGQVLGREHAQAQQQGGLGGGLLGSLLDQDGDGQVGLSDLMKIGGSLLGGRR